MAMSATIETHDLDPRQRTPGPGHHVLTTSHDIHPQRQQLITGFRLGEWFRDNGKHAVIVYDDLSKQLVSPSSLLDFLR